MRWRIATASCGVAPFGVILRAILSSFSASGFRSRTVTRRSPLLVESPCFICGRLWQPLAAKSTGIHVTVKISLSLIRSIALIKAAFDNLTGVRLRCYMKIRSSHTAVKRQETRPADRPLVPLYLDTVACAFCGSDAHVIEQCGVLREALRGERLREAAQEVALTE